MRAPVLVKCLRVHVILPVVQDALNAAMSEQQAAAGKAAEQLAAATRARQEAELGVQRLERELEAMSRRLLDLAGTGPGPAHPVSGEDGQLQTGTLKRPVCYFQC